MMNMGLLCLNEIRPHSEHHHDEHVGKGKAILPLSVIKEYQMKSSLTLATQIPGMDVTCVIKLFLVTLTTV